MIIEQLKNIIEAALLASAVPLSVDKLQELFTEDEEVSNDDIGNALNILGEDCAVRGIELKEVRSGFRLQVKQVYTEWVSKLWQERPSKYSKALLETLALVAYRQPITRGEVEQVRGVSVSSHIMKTLLERNWVKIVGHRDVPGKPGLYATTKDFLDYFNLKNLSDLPPLSEIRDIDSINAELELEMPAAPITEPKDEQGQSEEQSDDQTEEASENQEIELSVSIGDEDDIENDEIEKLDPATNSNNINKQEVDDINDSDTDSDSNKEVLEA